MCHDLFVYITRLFCMRDITHMKCRQGEALVANALGRSVSVLKRALFVCVMSPDSFLYITRLFCMRDIMHMTCRQGEALIVNAPDRSVSIKKPICAGLDCKEDIHIYIYIHA